jgi:hypothetical protein
VAPVNAAATIAAGFHLLKTARQGIAVERSDIGYLRDRSIKVTTEPPQKVALDGELIGTTPVEIQYCSVKERRGILFAFSLREQSPLLQVRSLLGTSGVVI